MSHIKIYLQAAIELCVLLIASLADLDMEIRIVMSVVGVILSLMTCYKLGQQIRRAAMENKIKMIELRRKEEEERLYFQNLHSK